jgi:hypothetical protein
MTLAETIFAVAFFGLPLASLACFAIATFAPFITERRSK